MDNKKRFKPYLLILFSVNRWIQLLKGLSYISIYDRLICHWERAMLRAICKGGDKAQIVKKTQVTHDFMN